ncbi:MAG: hypothetical protein O6923_02355 [Actinobacteria bacterium]|nr:hypothetical protein [Actinomycetota bacterium]
MKSFASDGAAAHEDVVASAQDLDDAVFDQIKKARADLQDAVDSIPDDGTMAETSHSLLRHGEPM